MANKRNLALAAVGVLTIILVATLALVLLTGSSDSKGLDKARAKEQSAAALLSAPDLPGGAWRTRDNDKFNEETNNLQTDACKEQNEAYQDALKYKEYLAGRSQRALEFSNATPSFVVEEWVEVYNSESRAKELEAKMGRLMSDSMPQCINDTNKGRGVIAQRVDSRVAVPAGGKVIAMELRSQNSQVILRSEYYYWRYGNTAVTVLVNGSQDRVSADFVKAVIEKAQANLDVAASK